MVTKSRLSNFLNQVSVDVNLRPQGRAAYPAQVAKELVNVFEEFTNQTFLLDIL